MTREIDAKRNLKKEIYPEGGLGNMISVENIYPCKAGDDAIPPEVTLNIQTEDEYDFSSEEVKVPAKKKGTMAKSFNKSPKTPAGMVLSIRRQIMVITLYA